MQRQKNSLSLDMAAASNPRDRQTHQSSARRKKTALVAALCPAQARPALVAKAGRPLELSLEGSILPRHGCAGTTTKERPGARTFSNRLFDCTFSHSHILSPCQPQTALFPLFRPQTSSPMPSATPRPILEVDQMCPSPIVAAKNLARRHCSGCLGRRPWGRNREPNKINVPTPL